MTTVNIVPGVSMYGVLSHLNYKPWFAFAEFVDNAVQSSIDRADELMTAEDDDYCLTVSIDIDGSEGGTISIRDNAAGIARGDFPRAFRAAEVPPNASGLSEFGMGMKSASCWFAREWQVRTTALGENEEHTVRFDVASVVKNKTERLLVESIPVAAGLHYTEVTLRKLLRLPAGRTVAKIKQHLTDIYRVLIRSGKLVLRYNGEVLEYKPPEVLEAPYYRNPDSPTQLWRKDIAFDLSETLSIRGFAALRSTGSSQNSGFSLFRRGRVIQGSGDEGYRPVEIFGSGNSFRSQRLFGELHLEGFAVSHTKDGFQWGHYEEEFLGALRSALDSEPLPLLRQAEGYRKIEATRSQIRQMEAAVESAAAAIDANLPHTLAAVAQADDAARENGSTTPLPVLGVNQLVRKRVEFEHSRRWWTIDVEVTSEPGLAQWLTKHVDVENPSRVLAHLRLNSAHPFLVRFGQRDAESFEVIVRFAAAIVVAETLARQAAVRQAGVLARNINEVITRALSGP